MKSFMYDYYENIDDLFCTMYEQPGNCQLCSAKMDRLETFIYCQLNSVEQ